MDNKGNIMKKYLLPKDGKFFKANLHCHTTISDGKWSPELVKEEYKKQGYSIVAFTDHDIMVKHTHLNDESFLALNGYEMEVNAPSEIWGMKPTCHMCLVALRDDIENQVCWNKQRNGYLWGNGLKSLDRAKFDPNEPDFEREYTHECISKMMQAGRDAGYFVTYNHPTWSIENYPNYIGYNGMHAMEIVNYGCIKMGMDDFNPRVYDDMLRAGKKIYCIATDDNHNGVEDSFGGFTMIKAEKLEYNTIGKALLNGDFYASEAPIISELYVEDEYVYVKCSPAKKVYLTTDVIYSIAVYPEEGETLTFAKLKINKNAKYFRITVEDASGKHACTNAYFIEDIFND